MKKGSQIFVLGGCTILAILLMVYLVPPKEGLHGETMNQRASVGDVIEMPPDVEGASENRGAFTPDEVQKINDCLARNMRKEYNTSWDDFFKRGKHTIRYNSHTYLNRDSTMIEIGGNVGGAANVFQGRFHPRRYVILEPIKKYYDILVKKFKKFPNVVVLDFGLAKEERVDMVEITGEGTSKFKNVKDANRTVPMKQVPAKDFFRNICLGLYELDLLTMNCEGCEYDVLDTLIETGKIKSVRHLQISFHHFPVLGNTHKRWCELQQIFSRTHRMAYQYPFFWESWTRKDLSK